MRTGSLVIHTPNRVQVSDHLWAELHFSPSPLSCSSTEWSEPWIRCSHVTASENDMQLKRTLTCTVTLGDCCLYLMAVRRLYKCKNLYSVHLRVNKHTKHSAKSKICSPSLWKNPVKVNCRCEDKLKNREMHTWNHCWTLRNRLNNINSAALPRRILLSLHLLHCLQHIVHFEYFPERTDTESRWLWYRDTAHKHIKHLHMHQKRNWKHVSYLLAFVLPFLWDMKVSVLCKNMG